MRETVWRLALAAALAVSCAGEQSNEPDAAVVRDDAGGARDGGVIRLPDASRPPIDASTMGAGPPYPIVLAHGFFGFEDFAGVDFITYFYGVKDALAAGGEVVFTPAVDPFNDSESRGEELLAHVERIATETGAAKINLIGHSQGGLDSRYVAHQRPDLVASVTTFATPHRGTPIADVVLDLVQDPRFQSLADRLVRLIGAALWDASGQETSVFRSLRQLSTPGADAFNARYPNQAGVLYYSITGRTDGHDGGTDCAIADAPPFIGRYRRTLDPVEPLLDIPESIVDGDGDIANDGLVRVHDARWGRFLGCVPADHFDEIGQLFGDSPGRGNDFDHLRFYIELVAWLRAQGL